MEFDELTLEWARSQYPSLEVLLGSAKTYLGQFKHADVGAAGLVSALVLELENQLNRPTVVIEDLSAMQEAITKQVLEHSVPCGDTLCSNKACVSWYDAEDATW